MEEHLNVDKYFIQHPAEAAVVTTMPNLAYKLIPLSLEGQSLLQQKKTHLLYEILAWENNIRQIETALNQRESSIKLLLFHMRELEQKKTNLLIELQQLHHQIDEINSSDAVQDLLQSLESLKALEWKESALQPYCEEKESDLQPHCERKESDLQPHCERKESDLQPHCERKESDLQPHCEQTHSDSQSEMLNLEKDILTVNERQHDLMNLDQSLIKSSNKLRLAKRELAAKLRAILLLRRQIDDVPAQTELIQYEHRFSELYVQIQEKHHQTCKHYATYNTLLEAKELMLKEISLLNSIDLQFQDAMMSTTGRSKLVNSMEVIVKGTQQKLEKVQFSFLVEQKHSQSLMEKYMTAIAEQRHFSSLLKSFQEECAKNQKLRSLTSV